MIQYTNILIGCIDRLVPREWDDELFSNTGEICWSMEFSEVVDHPDKEGQYLTPTELEAYLLAKQERQDANEAAAAAAAAAVRVQAGDAGSSNSTDSAGGTATTAAASSVHPASLGSGPGPRPGREGSGGDASAPSSSIASSSSSSAAAAAAASAESDVGASVLTSGQPWMDDMQELGLGSESIHPGAIRVVVKNAGRAAELKAQGNARYKAGDFFEAIRLYGRAICYCPLDDAHNHSRAVFHSNRAACHLAVGRHEQCIDDCSVAVDLDPRYVRALMRRAKAYEKIERLEDAVEDLDAAVAVDSSYAPALQEQRRVKQLYHEKTEKMKEEMLGKLKGLGNTILGKFGMSLDNFKLKPQEGGGYSVAYEQ
jgi:tetratricopeptide (TPR) repeat protein